MNKILYIAAALSLFAACNRIEIEDKTTNSSDGTRFEEGQEVTLTIGASGATKVNGILNADNDVNFKWEAGDAIKVTVNGTSSQFVVSELIDGGACAKFKGFMPAGGSTFDVQFPYDTPDLTTQEYVENGVPHNMMLATATDCTVDAPFALDPQNAALRLNFYGYDRKVTSIAVTNTTADPNVTYTLNCATPVKVGVTEANATPFLMVVPTGTYSFTVQVTADEVIPNVDNDTIYEDGGYSGSGVVVTAGNFATISDKTFSSANVKNMPARSITQIWAPVNCGYVPKTGDSGEALGYPYGKLYQWGRKDGQGYNDANYEDATYPSGSNLVNGQVSNIGNLVASYYYYGNKIWYSGNNPDPDQLWQENERSQYDPCPGGWKVPIKDQLEALTIMTNKSWVTGKSVDGIGVGTYNGYLFDNKLFLPAAGGRYYMNAKVSGRNENGYYWSSSVDDNSNAWAWTISNTGAPYSYIDGRGGGCSVRCVVDENAVYTGATLPGDMPNVSGSW